MLKTRFLFYPMHPIAPGSPYLDHAGAPIDLEDDGELPVSLAAALFLWSERESRNGVPAHYSTEGRHTHLVCGVPPYAVAWDREGVPYAVRIVVNSAT